MGKVIIIYSYLLEQCLTEFETVRMLKKTSRGSVEVLRHKTSGNAYILRRFDGTSEVYRRLLHVSSPNLPRVYEAVERAGETAVLEEYIHGDTLFDMLKQISFSAKETKRISMELCRALFIIHGFGAVHRDVKPENVILRPSGAVLTDFDASRVFKQDASGDTRVLGTVGYAPPEQFGLSQTDARSDIYSLGVLMNVMLTGKHPSLKTADGHLGRVIQKCTMTAPEKRYKDILHLMEAL